MECTLAHDTVLKSQNFARNLFYKMYGAIMVAYSDRASLCSLEGFNIISNTTIIFSLVLCNEMIMTLSLYEKYV
jgi:hypothetical protein